MEGKRRAWTGCVGLGAGYGAVCGALFFVVFGALPAGSHEDGRGFLTGMLTALLGGAGVGAIGGAVTGGIGSLLEGRLGWCLAAVLGGVATGILLAGPVLAYLARHELRLGPTRLLVLLVPAWVAISLGLAIGRGLQSGQSPLPGVRALALVVHRESPPMGVLDLPSLPGEVVPARTPPGRGDEAAPAETRDGAVKRQC